MENADPTGTETAEVIREVARHGNATEDSDLSLTRHHIGHTIANMMAANTTLSVHDHPELKARAVEFIRRLQEFDKIVEKQQSADSR